MRDFFLTTVQEGLDRQSSMKCSTWASNYRMMGEPFRGKFGYKYHPWLKEMHDHEGEIQIGQKAAQMGYTEYALNRAFYHIDMRKESVAYFLPAQRPDAENFSASRFDPALEESPHLTNMFSSVKNVGHKRAGSANLYIRGTRSRSQLKSIPARVLIFDEVDEMEMGNVILAMERASGQRQKLFIMISTPTTYNRGINYYYERSSKNHFFFKCPLCSRRTELVFPDCLEITADREDDPDIINSFLKCKECKGRLHNEDKPDFLQSGIWVPENQTAMDQGWHINQLYSSGVAGRPDEFAKKALRADKDPVAEQEFWNSNCGLTHEPEGAKLTATEIEACKGGYQNDRLPRSPLVTLGVDVGKVLHCWMDEWYLDDSILSGDMNAKAIARTLLVTTLRHFEELDELMLKYYVTFSVIDAQPERHAAQAFAERFPGIVKCCFYTRGSGKYIHATKGLEESHVNANRTGWMDMGLNRFRAQTIMIPDNIPAEAVQNLTAPTKIYVYDEFGQPEGKYVKEENKPDHYAHARTYSEVAFSLGSKHSTTQDIKERVL